VQAANTKRPWSVTIIAWLYLATGLIGFLHHATDFKASNSSDYGPIWVCAVSLLAIVCGAFLLRGANWARWLSVAWIGFHVILSALHSMSESAMHGLLFAIILFSLFHRQATAYFLRCDSTAQTSGKIES
jgi:hypothetical protein